ncbi:monofunctional biosynthetic peptidoglycan transglycosylase [Rhodohalobacter halophilus]|uniref:monofunctional biosynthetic peptidoglycan transglycosylase n=1 Tax=Rhodohalobacter halophilus TaxID=1812810 RepID=UPI00083FA62A|nr:monofunctional biosynthetic peptidoglycan transglycosylase [Rhodohalobacter halophilus]
MKPANPDSKPTPYYKKVSFYLISIVGIITLLLSILLISVISYRWYNPDSTRFFAREDWSQFNTEPYSLKQFWVSYEEIPDHMKWAVVASEDQLFWEHSGFDIESIREAWEERQAGERTRGASTITQQVAKNLYLSPAQSFFRKGIEAGITVLIELFWSKERIIEVYLNIAEFGPGIFGIGYAADQYWGIPATEITPEMSAQLAAVLPSPKRMRVNPPSPFAEERSLWILRQMTQLSGIAYVQPEETEPEKTHDFDDVDPYLMRAEFNISQFRVSDQTDTSNRGSSGITEPNDSLRQLNLPDSLKEDDGVETDTTDTLQKWINEFGES